MAFIPIAFGPSMSASIVSPTNTVSSTVTPSALRASWKISGLGFRLLMDAETITISKKSISFEVLSSLKMHSGIAKFDTIPSLYFPNSCRSDVFACGSIWT